VGSILEVRNLTKRFGGLTAVAGLDFDLREGEILGLIGPNGAGKTTTFNIIAGTYAADHGASCAPSSTTGRSPACRCWRT
jgi:ABC-type branched-subunit amino acid transport system ATPase component